MSNTTGLHLFLQTVPVTDEQLFKLIELRMVAIKPLLEDAPLRPLNDWMFVDHRGRGGSLRFENRKGELLGFFLPPHGNVECHIFPAMESAEPVELSFWRNDSEKYAIPAHYVYHWGLDRDGRWMILKAEFWEDPKNGPCIHNVWIEQVESAQVLCDKLKLQPRTVLNHLCEMVVGWTDGAKASYEELVSLRDSFYDQNGVLKALDALKS